MKLRVFYAALRNGELRARSRLVFEKIEGSWAVGVNVDVIAESHGSSMVAFQSYY